MVLWGVTLAAIQTNFMVEDYKDRQTRKKVAALTFENVMTYYSIFPPESTVYYEADARFVSDAEIHKIIETIPGGVKVTWNEAIMCDNNPYDSRDNYEYYREAEPTAKTYIKSRSRRPMSQLRELKGYPILMRRNEGYAGQLLPIQYPRHDADCRLSSVMRMHMPDGSVKRFEKHSEVVQVRGVIPD
ncbi:hypothetical protein [uncultured Paraglaciecola sp.]|uniref:hypothetical protein n=1 Tax=uncultured Paraglaciecola sp. TaxID=1765024 RepID=UPI002612BE73|nr:hypothetical protein [uncultured Paraglaciecola sp.]